MTVVLDASALLAFLNAEAGAEVVKPALDGAHVGAVNWSEVVQKSLQKGVDVVGMQTDFMEIGVAFEPFTATQAEVAAQLWKTTKRYGLSMADRACLALALDFKASVLTADRAWTKLKLNLDIQLIR